MFGKDSEINKDSEKTSSQGKFGKYGGRYVPPELERPLEKLSEKFERIKENEKSQRELKSILEKYAGRPTPLYHAKNLSEKYGAEIYLKREDLLHGGAHKINNTLGQALLAKKMGKKRLIAETGAGQHGVATAMAGALLGLETEIYMGKKDFERQKMNVFRMKLLGAKFNKVEKGDSGLSDAIDLALRDFSENLENTHYLVGSVVGPDPYPRIVREFQSVIGKEARNQILKQSGKLPDALVACIGGGSNAIGLFHEFRDDQIDLYGAEGGGKGIESKRHAAPLAKGKDGTIHGMKTRVIGENVKVHSIASGLDYPGVGPEHAHFRQMKRCEYHAITDEKALESFKNLSEYEGIIPALESSHALALTKEIAERKNYETIIVNLSGRGDKDMNTAKKKLDLDS